MYEMTGLVKMPQRQVIEHFRDCLSALGIECKTNMAKSQIYNLNTTTALVYPHAQDASIPVRMMTFAVYDLNDLGGWTFFTCSVALLRSESMDGTAYVPVE